MRIRFSSAVVTFAAAVAVAPFAGAHGTDWRAHADSDAYPSAHLHAPWWTPAGSAQSFAQMQSASTEAPAFHTGDRSIYDSSRALEPSARVATAPQPAAPGGYDRQRAADESAMQARPRIDSAAQLDVDPANSVPSVTTLPNRPGAAVERYGSPMK